MKHRTFEEIGQVAEIIPAQIPPMDRRERLERWAAVLLRQPLRPLAPFSRLEFLHGHEGAGLRQDNSPVALAFADPVLRAAGLAGDRIGDAMDFFRLSCHETHLLLCDCHYQGTMTGARVAADLRRIAGRGGLRGAWQRLVQAYFG